MKKIKLLALFLALIMVVTAFASCGKKDKDPEPTPEPVTFDELLNTEYTEEKDGVIQSLSHVSELDGYTLYTQTHSYHEDAYYNDEIALFVTNNSSDIDTFKLFSFRQGKVVQTFTETDAENGNIQYTFQMYDYDCSDNYYYDDTTYKTPLLKVTKSQDSKPDICSLVDPSGVELVSRRYSIDDTPYFFRDWVVIGKDAYELNETTGAYTKKFSIPLNLDTDIFDYENGKYIYEHLRSGVANVYDYNFNVVATYALPANTNLISFFVLNDGNLFIQYEKKLNPEVIEYDYYRGDTAITLQKFDLVTEIFSIESKVATPIDMNYYVYAGFSYSVIDANEETKGMYAADKFDNLIEVYPIVDQRVCQVAKDVDFLLMANDGTIGDSLKLVENQTSIPSKVAKDTYVVSTLYGCAFVDVEGKVLSQITNTNVMAYEYVAGYILTNDGIYDMSFKLVYDLDANNANVIRCTDNVILVEQYELSSHSYKILSFANGTQKEIFKYDSAATAGETFSTLGDMYVIYNPVNGTYKYYNLEGKELASINLDLNNGIIESEQNECALVAYVEVIGATPNYTWYFAK